MKASKTGMASLAASLLFALALLAALPLIATGRDSGDSLPGVPASLAAASTQTSVISGTYAGTVAISQPVALGVFDLVFTVADVDGTLTGTVETSRTLAYSCAQGDSCAPVLHGGITGSVNDITPTFRIDSAVFGGSISGREVQRSFALVGEALESGQTLQGQYTEVISGFTPNPLTTQGAFLVVRPDQPSETTTPEPPPKSLESIYLPVVLRDNP